MCWYLRAADPALALPVSIPALPSPGAFSAYFRLGNLPAQLLWYREGQPVEQDPDLLGVPGAQVWVSGGLPWRSLLCELRWGILLQCEQALLEFKQWPRDARESLREVLERVLGERFPQVHDVYALALSLVGQDEEARPWLFHACVALMQEVTRVPKATHGQAQTVLIDQLDRAEALSDSDRWMVRQRLALRSDGLAPRHLAKLWPGPLERCCDDSLARLVRALGSSLPTRERKEWLSRLPADYAQTREALNVSDPEPPHT